MSRLARLQAIYESYELPIAHYKAVEHAETLIAACVLIAPEFCPTSAQLPRDLLSEELRALVALAPLHRSSPAKLALEIEKRAGWAWVYKLLTEPSARVSELPFYCNVMRELRSYEKQAAAALQALLDLEEKAGKISATVPGTRGLGR